ncbi:hypothetical protein KSS87_009778 [Heliosperma pusillum]|nr:hypothetical protein KSS87_009778 [Heliosperma pusillum]
MWSLGKDIVLGEILPKIPPKSLIRLKCVSKSFQTLISSREFIQRYLCYHSLSSSDDDLLIIPKDGSILCYNLDSSTPVATFTWHDSGSLVIIGTCNGLLCTRPPNVYDHWTLLNPTTRILWDMVPRLGHNSGLAFDPVNLDFKIVGFADERNDEAINTRVTEVYSFNANSCTTLDTQFPTDSVEGWHDGGVVVNHYLVHWMFWKPSLRKRRIGCFDVCKMDWTDDVLLPSYYYDPTRRNYLLDLGVLDGRLSSSFENEADSCFDVWVMIEYGVQDSWFKLFSIPISSNLREGVIPVASRSSSVEILIRQRHSSNFYWYDRADGRMSEAKFDGLPNTSHLKTYMCSKSMVDIPGGRIFEDR